MQLLPPVTTSTRFTQCDSMISSRVTWERALWLALNDGAMTRGCYEEKLGEGSDCNGMNERRCFIKEAQRGRALRPVTDPLLIRRRSRAWKEARGQGWRGFFFVFIFLVDKENAALSRRSLDDATQLGHAATLSARDSECAVFFRAGEFFGCENVCYRMKMSFKMKLIV